MTLPQHKYNRKHMRQKARTMNYTYVVDRGDVILWDCSRSVFITKDCVNWAGGRDSSSSLSLKKRTPSSSAYVSGLKIPDDRHLKTCVHCSKLTIERLNRHTHTKTIMSHKPTYSPLQSGA